MPRSALRRPTATLALTAVTGALLLAPAAEAKTVTVKTTGKKVSLKVGDRLVVNLAENPTTGYAWATKSRPTFLKQLSTKYTADPVDPGVAGSGGRRVITYKASKKGTGTLKLVDQRSFAPSADDQKFTVKVTVR